MGTIGVLLLGISLAVTGFPVQATPAPVQRGQLKLFLDHAEPCCGPGWQRYYVRIEGHNGARRVIEIPDFAQQVNGFTILNDKLGMISLQSIGGIHLLVDMDSGETVGELGSYSEVKQSPSGRYLAYIPSAPVRSFVVTADAVMVYDLTLTREQNHIDGFAVPPGTGQGGPDVPAVEQHESTVSWLDSDVLAIVESYHTPQDELRLQVVDLRQGVSQQKVLLQHEVLNGYCKWAGPLTAVNFTHVPNTSNVSFILGRVMRPDVAVPQIDPCGQFQVTVPGL